MLSNEQFVTALLALCLWQHKNEHGIQGAKAIGFCIRNRVKSGWGNWTGVLRVAMPEHEAVFPILNDPDWQTIRVFADDLYLNNEMLHDPTNGATWWKPVPNGQRVSMVGKLPLYR